MRLVEMIDELKGEVVRLNDVIAMLEQIGSRESAPRPARTNKGRRSMCDEERRQVAERMRRYWEQRKAASAGENSAQI